MEIKSRNWSWVILLSVLLILTGSLKTFGAQHPCCPEDPELSYLLNPKPSQKFHYLVRYETFLSAALGKEKGFFIILPEEFYQNPKVKYPVLYLLHGYNFHRRGWNWKAKSQEEARKILCEVKEEEYHWLLHEDIALIAYAMMDPKNRTYRELQRSLEDRFDDLSRHGDLDKGDYRPREIAQSIISYNLHPAGNPDDPFHPIQKMIIVLPDGDNGFYTDENEGKRLFPETKDQGTCDSFRSEEYLNYSLFPFLRMKPGALGKYESYFLELLRYIDTHSQYKERLLLLRGIGGMSMGGFGAMKLGLKYPSLFQSISSQSGLLDIGLLSDKWMLKMVLPEFLEIFGRLEPRRLPPSSSLDLKHIQSNNPVSLLKKERVERLPRWIYFDYGEKEGYSWIMEGNQNFEKALGERSHQIPVQPFNGNSEHNYQFWRTRSGNILRHHSDVFQKWKGEKAR
jgi:S-formylglutathione hydrolase FrmB